MKVEKLYPGWMQVVTYFLKSYHNFYNFKDNNGHQDMIYIMENIFISDIMPNFQNFSMRALTVQNSTSF